MQKINALGASVVLFLAIASNASAQAPGPADGSRKDNISTVNELLKIENAKAMDQSKKEAEALGLTSRASTSKNGATTSVRPPATLIVDSISGVGDQLRADVSYNGMRYERMLTASHIGPCRIESVKGRRVTLARTGKKVRADQCPFADWTGGPNPAERDAASINVVSSPLPMPLPLPISMPLPAGALATSMQTPGANAR